MPLQTNFFFEVGSVGKIANFTTFWLKIRAYRLFKELLLINKSGNLFSKNYFPKIRRKACIVLSYTINYNNYLLDYQLDNQLKKLKSIIFVIIVLCSRSFYIVCRYYSSGRNGTFCFVWCKVHRLLKLPGNLGDQWITKNIFKLYLSKPFIFRGYLFPTHF